MAENKELPSPSDDGLTFAEVGSWAEDKYRLVAIYDKLFATGMKDKWDKRVYIDLFCGSGISKLRGGSRFFYGHL